MPAKKSAVPPEIYQIKVTLLGTSPPIWRRLLVPADVALAQLHDVLQTAMGWDDGHMHEFSVGSRRIGRSDPEDRHGNALRGKRAHGAPLRHTGEGRV
jgi:Plasmid pRiA4b ORF-3-like protein